MGVKGKRGRDERRGRKTAVGAMFVCSCVRCFLPCSAINAHSKK